MATMRAPEGVTQFSVEQQVFTVGADGTVIVPDAFIPRLMDVGFKPGPFRITVSPDVAAGLLAQAKAAADKAAADKAAADKAAAASEQKTFDEVADQNAASAAEEAQAAAAKK